MGQSKIKVTARENSLPAENEFQKTDLKNYLIVSRQN